jgi:hypothetical protein
MKKPNYISKLGLITYWALLPWCLSAQTPGPFTGIWEGDFMEQFKTLVLLDQADGSAYSGKILMYSDENRIQDDELSRIVIGDGSISFYIAAKETSFQGTFNEENSAFSGNLVFPDNSRHPLSLVKYEGDNETLNESKSSRKEELRLNIPVDELKSDLKDLIRKLKRYHPRLYSYTTEEAFDATSGAILASLDEDLTPEQFFFRIAPLVESIRCSHTGIRLPAAYSLALQEQGQYFPLVLYIRGQQAYCLSAPGIPDTQMVPGMEILAINHMPVEQIIRDLLAIIPSEGNCMTTKYQELNRNFPSYYHMLDPAETYYVEYASSSGKESLQLEACPYARVQPPENMQQSDCPYNFNMEENSGLGVLAISSFGIPDLDAYFYFLDSAFQQMKQSGTPSLVLDLRDNRGGHPIFAAQLFSYLTDYKFTYFQRNPDVPEFEPLYGVMEPNALHFSGSLYVLVNGNCLSTTGHLISLLKYHTPALFIGEEPGSTYTCNDHSIQFTLPHSGIEVNIPQTTFVTDVRGFLEEEPFHPDYEVMVSIDDLLDGKDSYTSLVLRLIKEQKSRP